jgi:dihydrofolate reductase
MSYLVSAVIIKPKEGETTVNYALIGGFDGMAWHMHEKDPEYIKKLNASVIPKILAAKGKTTMEKLLTAPMDEVIILDGDTYESMKGRKPLDNTKGKIQVNDYLKEGVEQN